MVGFYDGWPAGRKFQVDMAGFSVGVGYLKKQASMLTFMTFLFDCENSVDNYLPNSDFGMSLYF